jgi:antitoxin CcdA
MRKPARRVEHLDMPKAKGFAENSGPSGLRRATNVSLDSELLREAKALEVNISRACERGLAQAVAAAKEKRWLEENGKALDAANAFVQARGIPLARHRKF